MVVERATALRSGRYRSRGDDSDVSLLRYVSLLSPFALPSGQATCPKRVVFCPFSPTIFSPPPKWACTNWCRMARKVQENLLSHLRLEHTRRMVCPSSQDTRWPGAQKGLARGPTPVQTGLGGQTTLTRVTAAGTQQSTTAHRLEAGSKSPYPRCAHPTRRATFEQSKPRLRMKVGTPTWMTPCVWSPTIPGMGVVGKTLRAPTLEVRGKGNNPPSTLVHRPTKCLSPQPPPQPPLFASTKINRQKHSTLPRKGEEPYQAFWGVRGPGAMGPQTPWHWAHRTFSAFGLLGNKGMHSLNGNTEETAMLAWLQLVQLAGQDIDLQPREVKNIGSLFELVLNCHAGNYGEDTPLTLKHVETHARGIARYLMQLHNISIGPGKAGARFAANITAACKVIFDARLNFSYERAPTEATSFRAVRSEEVIPIKLIPGRSSACKREIEMARSLANVTATTNYKWWSKAYASHCIVPLDRIGQRHSSPPSLVDIQLSRQDGCHTPTKLRIKQELPLHDCKSTHSARCNKAMLQLEKVVEDLKIPRVSAGKADSMGRKIVLEVSAPSAILPTRLRPDNPQQGVNHLTEEWFSLPPGETATLKETRLDTPIRAIFYLPRWRLTTTSPTGRIGFLEATRLFNTVVNRFEEPDNL